MKEMTRRMFGLVPLTGGLLGLTKTSEASMPPLPKPLLYEVVYNEGLEDIMCRDLKEVEEVMSFIANGAASDLSTRDDGEDAGDPAQVETGIYPCVFDAIYHGFPDVVSIPIMTDDNRHVHHTYERKLRWWFKERAKRIAVIHDQINARNT